ncbi:MAG: hypothetical protein QXO32_04870 [Candidatus Bathyarchaeia archaeon]
MRNLQRKNRALLALFLILLGAQPLLGASYAQRGAVIEELNYPSKVYEGEDVTVRVSVVNRNVPDSDANFYMRVKSDEIVILDEFPNTWQCPQGSSVKRRLTLHSVTGPPAKTFTIALLRQNQSLTIVEDEKTFTVEVVNLKVVDVKLEEGLLHVGENKSMVFSFRNGGNDVMYEVEAMFVSRELLIQPNHFMLGELEPLQKAVGEVMITFRNGTVGVKDVPVEVTFSDFRGIVHKERFSLKVTVEKVETRLDIAGPGEVVFSSPIQFKARLLDAHGNPIVGEKVVFEVDDLEVGSAITDGEGWAAFNSIVNFTAGKHRFMARYIGSESLKPAESAVEFHVSQAETTLKLYAPPEMFVNEGYRLLAKLSEGGAMPMETRLITFYLDGSKLDVVETNGTGFAELVFKPEVKGSHILRAEYGGDENYRGSKAEIETIVRAIETRVTVSSSSVIFEGSMLRTTAYLLDSSGQGIPHASLRMEVVLNGKVVEQRIFETDKDGRVDVKIPFHHPGQMLVNVIYGGDEKRDPAQAQFKVLVISRIFVLLLALAGAAVAGVLIALKWGWVQRLKLGWGEESALGGAFRYKPCTSCGEMIPSTSRFCDRCGVQQDEGQRLGLGYEAPQTVEGPTLDEKVFKYIAERGGEISISKAEKDLGVTRSQLLDAVDRLRRAGKLE